MGTTGNKDNSPLPTLLAMFLKTIANVAYTKYTHTF